MLGVYVLTEFIFCARAGLCAFEKGNTEEEAETTLVNVDYLPSYDLREIEAALEKTLNEMWLLILSIVGTGLLAGLLSWLLHPGVICAGFLVMAWFACFATLRLRVVYTLMQRRQLCLTAPPSEPDPNKLEVQQITWWGLLKAGYESIPCKDPLIDESAKLKGRVWRLLRRGGVAIPVWRMQTYDGKLYPQHFARMAAFCHLVKAAMGAESPFGVILVGNGYDGFCLPNSSPAQKLFSNGLRLAREVLRNSEERIDPKPPVNPSICTGCPFGFPVIHRPGATDNLANGKKLRANLAQSDDQCWYHSHCGDRFRWLPPHKMVVEKDLRLQV